MKLLYAFPEPLPLPRARGIQAINAVSALARTGVSIQLCHVDSDGVDPFESGGITQPSSLTRLTLSNKLPGPLSKLLPHVSSVKLFMWRLTRIINKLQPDAVFVRHIKLAFLVRNKFPDTALIYEAHEVFADTVAGKKRLAMTIMEQTVFRNTILTITNSNATAARIEEKYQVTGRVITLHNGVSPPLQLPEKPWGSIGRHIIYTGSFFGWKGVGDLIKAASYLPPNYHITLIGKSREESTELLTDTPKTSANLTFLPRLTQQEVTSYLSSSCIAILPNRNSTDSRFTSPIKLFEYMASGCAIVSSDIPSVREILDEEEASWFTAGDPKSLAESVQYLVENPKKAQEMGKSVRRKSHLYTWDTRAEKLASVLHEVLG